MLYVGFVGANHDCSIPGIPWDKKGKEGLTRGAK